MKTCKTCGETKEDSAFSFRRRACKVCRCVEQKERYLKTPEIYRASSMNWYEKNREEVLEKNRREYDPVENSEQCRKWRAENPEWRADYNAKYYKENKEELNAYSREHNANNRPAINKHRKERYNSDPLFKLTLLLRGRIGDALRGKTKSAKTKELLGAPWVWVEAYLEEQFQPGMSWENHGPVWEIDHIRPVSSFDLTDPEQQRMCFHWTNLQPLFTPDNRRKSDTYDPQNA